MDIEAKNCVFESINDFIFDGEKHSYQLFHMPNLDMGILVFKKFSIKINIEKIIREENVYTIKTTRQFSEKDCMLLAYIFNNLSNNSVD